MKEMDSDLVAYALGALDEAQAEQLRDEIESNAALKAELARAMAMITPLDEADTPLPPPPALRDDVLRSIDERTRFDGFATRLAALYDLSAARIEQLLALARAPHEAPWEHTRIPGTRLLHFDGGERLAGCDCGFAYMAPGTTFPAHRHLGDEWALILQGRLLENDSKEYQAGDLVYSPTGSAHVLQVLGDDPALLALATYTGIDFKQV